MAEKLHSFFPSARIDFLLRKGNEGLLAGHPFIRNIIVLDKKNSKFLSLVKIAWMVRKAGYDCVVNLHRFGSSGFVTCFSGSGKKIGFRKNPFSLCYSASFEHEIGNGKHETERNHSLIRDFTDDVPAPPRLYPSPEDVESVGKISGTSEGSGSGYICIAPASVWFTKQLPKEKWIELLNGLGENQVVYLLGSSGDTFLCEEIRTGYNNGKIKVENLAGKISLLETAALMKRAKMNFVNDSAPLHLASAMNAPVRSIFCSTVPAFGFGPLSGDSKIIETGEKLACRPCGLHGMKKCPEEHFKCAKTIVMKGIAD